MKNRVARAAAIMCVFFPASSLHAEDLSPIDAIELFETALMAIQSYDIELSVSKRHFFRREPIGNQKVTLKGGPTLDVPVTKLRELGPEEQRMIERSVYKQALSQGKRRVEYYIGRASASEKPADMVVSTDGQVERVYQSDSRRGIIQFLTVQHVALEADYEAIYRSVQGPSLLATLFRDRAKEGRLEAYTEPDGTLVIDAKPCEPIGAQAFAAFGFKVTLDPEYRLLPIQIERSVMYEGERKTYFRTNVDQFKQVDDGIFVPIKATSNYLIYREKEHSGEPSSEIVMEANVARSRWNVAVSPEVFALPFPSGTSVVDRLRSALYTTGQNDTGKNLKALAKGARDFIVLQEPSPIPTVPWWRSAIFFWTVILTLLVSLVAGTWYYLRRRARMI